MMASRALCVIAAAMTYRFSIWLAMAFVVGGTVLPWCAVLIANDVPASVFQKMRSVYLFLSVASPAEAERVHKLLAEGGEVYMPMEETFYATRFSMLRDRFGTSWMILHQKPMPANA